MRDEIVDFVAYWTAKLEVSVSRMLDWLVITPNRFYDFKKRYGAENQHNAVVPKSHWILPDEKEAIIVYAQQNPEEGYRRLTYMMLDANVCAVSPTTTYRVLKSANLLNDWSTAENSKGDGFVQPCKPHEHWHIDISYIKVACTFYYLISILDGFSRFIVQSELRMAMTENDVELTLQKAYEKFPGAKPRIISDNGKQFIAYDFKEFIRQKEMSHVTTSPCYPQSNGKLERWHRSLKEECVRPAYMDDYISAKQIIANYVEHYNCKRLHSAIGYIAPVDKLKGRSGFIFATRKRKLIVAQKNRQLKNEKGIHTI